MNTHLTITKLIIKLSSAMPITNVQIILGYHSIKRWGIILESRVRVYFKWTDISVCVHEPILVNFFEVSVDLNRLYFRGIERKRVLFCLMVMFYVLRFSCVWTTGSFWAILRTFMRIFLRRFDFFDGSWEIWVFKYFLNFWSFMWGDTNNWLDEGYFFWCWDKDNITEFFRKKYFSFHLV